MLSRPYAFNCIMRLRTSSEFKPGHSVSKTISVSMDHIFQGLVLVYAYDIAFCSMGISSLIHNMKMFSTLFVVILMQRMLMTLILPTPLVLPGTIMSWCTWYTSERCIAFYNLFRLSIGLLNVISLCRHTSEQPMLQIAFQYTVVVPPEELSSEGLGSVSRYG